MYSHWTWSQWSLGRVTHMTSTDLESKVTLGQWPLVQIFEKRVTVSTYFYVFSNLIFTMIAKVCDRESRRHINLGLGDIVSFSASNYPISCNYIVPSFLEHYLQIQCCRLHACTCCNQLIDLSIMNNKTNTTEHTFEI